MPLSHPGSSRQPPAPSRRRRITARSDSEIDSADMRRSALEGRDGEHKYKKGLSMSTSSTAQWSSRLGFILASAGSAIGIGAIWKFPFWAGANGGGAFIIPYIFFPFTIGVMLVMA